MARAGWFDPNTNELEFSGYFDKMESWQRALADGKVEAAEVRAQAERVAGLLKDLEPKLDDALHARVTQVLYELAVLYGMQALAEMTLQGERGQD
jgi:hypothetical protein